MSSIFPSTPPGTQLFHKSSSNTHAYDWRTRLWRRGGMADGNGPFVFFNEPLLGTHTVAQAHLYGGGGAGGGGGKFGGASNE
jgi:hypothetical protein